ncbi:hypothetical protein [Streptomyces sp. NPDC000983]|uniref:hypothetical protein n=1 Tax=Streptomyces sp. NPDC000983 TaxID=3154373 RepID=UPI00332CEC87
MDSEGHACPACGQSVETVVRRHKTLGAWVPRWVAGPCRNATCEAFVVQGTDEVPQERHKTHKHLHHHQRLSEIGGAHEAPPQPDRPEEPEEPAASGT